MKKSQLPFLFFIQWRKQDSIVYILNDIKIENS